MPDKPKRSLATHLMAGGVAGFCEAVACHPLDTIKVRMQLKHRSVELSNTSLSQPSLGFVQVGSKIVRNEGFSALYKGLGAVVSGIVPKMAIRFSSFEYYKGFFADKDHKVSNSGNFICGLAAGVTEAIFVVQPTDCIKIRLQAQRHSMSDAVDIPKYRNAAHAAYTIVKEEGVAAIYRGVTLTALRQATNQAANFTAYNYLKSKLQAHQGNFDPLPSYQTFIAGGIAGAMGPLFNAPIDTVKTRVQKSKSSQNGWNTIKNITLEMAEKEGWRSFYRGLTPRLLRVAPGQAVTFMVYEKVHCWILEMQKNLRVSDMGNQNYE